MTERGGGGGNGRGFPLPTVGSFLKICVWKRNFLHIPIPYILPASFEKLFYSNEGGGGMAPCALSYASDGGTARICQRGAKARERSDRAGGGCGSPSHGREIFQNLCLKTAFSCTLDTIIRGSLCSGIDQFPRGGGALPYWRCRGRAAGQSMILRSSRLKQGV